MLGFPWITGARLPAACTAIVAMLLIAPVPRVAAETAMPVAFLPHQVQYALSLKSTRNNVSVNNASGRILYNFTGNACDGYSSEFRQLSELDAGENRTIVSDLRSANWESGDGKSFRFTIQTQTNGEEPSVVDGNAERAGERIKVQLKKPAAKTLMLDGDVVFPTDQVKRIIAAARAGKSVLELKVYDGSDTGEKVYHTFTVIGQPMDAARATHASDIALGEGALKTVRRWPVTVSYYDKSAGSGKGEETPVYAMSFELYENGVSRALAIDYNDFVISGMMSSFEAKDVKRAKPCKP